MCEEQKSLTEDTKLLSKIVECIAMYTASLCYEDKDGDAYKDFNREADGLYLKLDRYIQRVYGERKREILNSLRNEDLQNLTIKQLVEKIEKSFD